jgi:hypothetical protein
MKARWLDDLDLQGIVASGALAARSNAIALENTR